MFNLKNFDMTALRKTLEVRVSPEYAAYLMDQIPRRESSFARSKRGSKDHNELIRPLTLMYMELNNQLGLVCKAIGYPLKQDNWEDSEPLSVLAKIYPDIQVTKWYQNHLMSILNGNTEHPWLHLTSISTKQGLTFPNEESARDLIQEHEFAPRRTKDTLDAE